MKWSSSPPDREGWWWYKGECDVTSDFVGVVQIFRYHNEPPFYIHEPYMDYYSRLDKFIDSWKGQWAGPLQEPEEG